jgi:undecaprenyl-phosphate galactose phosphotransferase
MVKRVFDIFCSLLLLILGLPVFFLCALSVKISSRGPVFYGHRRVGLGGKPFVCWKFRTMFIDAETRWEQLVLDPVLSQEWNRYYKLKVDPRVTPIGHYLRKFSLDELPQIFNVLKGDMSMVGPRPLTEHEVVHFLKEKSCKILSLRPGLTTIWIVKGRNRFTLKQRMRWEELYVDKHSFILDCRLIWETILAILFPKGAY